jgi:hypothetical protein
MTIYSEETFVDLVNASKAASERIEALEAALREIAGLSDVDADEAPLIAQRALEKGADA